MQCSFKNKVLAILLIVINIFAIGAKAQINAEQVLYIGRNVLSMEDYMLSIQYFNQAIKAKPYLAEPYFFRALAKLYLEDYKGAEEDCTMAIARNKFKTETYKIRGFARQNLGKDSLAVLDYDAGLQHNPEDKYFLFYKGVAQTQMKHHEEAEETFDKLLKIYPQFEDGYTARGRLRVQAGDTVGALADLDKAIDISRNLLNAHLLRAQIRADKKEWEAALADMDEAIKLEPQEADLYVNRAYLRYNADDYFGAMSDYNYTLELEPYNSMALFNRALLRYEVKDLNRAAEDFKSVLNLDKDNFHARYNLGLVDLERGHNKEALENFNIIAQKYPRFYPIYYAKAEALRNMGNMHQAIIQAHTGDELVAKYVKNSEKNPLDRPTIAPGKTHDADIVHDEDEDEVEIMNRFNQLVTVGEKLSETQLSYNEKVKGRVQDRNINVEFEPDFTPTLLSRGESLRNISNYFRELDDFNQHKYVTDNIYLEPRHNISDEQALNLLFRRGDYYEDLKKDNHARPADLLILAVIRASLKNYQEAIQVLDSALNATPDFTVAIYTRAAVRQASLDNLSVPEKEETEMERQLRQRQTSHQIELIISDYDRALRLNPRLTFAWFNKGNLYSRLGDYTSAIQCYSEALKLDQEFGSAYYNRGLAYLHMGNKRLAFSDISKAGELGVIPSYNLLKRMK